MCGGAFCYAIMGWSYPASAADVVTAQVAQASSPEAQAAAKAKAPDSRADSAHIETYRAPFDVLSERLLGETMIGTASRAVRFDWRQKSVAFGILGGQLLELNNFKSARYGLFVRKPFSGWFGELAITRVSTWGSASTEKLARTPYRQIGRPDRFELDVNVAYPLVEGVATARPGIVPAAEIVLSAIVSLRYLFYHQVLQGGSFTEAVKSFVGPRLSSKDLRLLEDSRPAAMQIDRGRFNTLGGLNLDIYFAGGGFVTSRTLVALPLTGSELGWWWELSLAAGWMF